MKHYVMVYIVIAALVVAGCAGTPEPEPDPTPEPEPMPAEEDSESHRIATQLRTIVERTGFGVESPEEFAAAETAYTTAEQTRETDPATANNLYREAAQGYRTVIRDGSSNWSSRARETIDDRRREARSVRAEVAQRERYEQAERDFERAQELLQEEEYVAAFEAYEEAREGFTEAFRRAREQRERARERLEDLDSRIVDSTRRLEALQDDLEDDDE